jgi:hypothetical protein
MQVVMKHVSGTAKDNVERAKEELTRVLGFRGNVLSAKAKGQRIILEIDINQKWKSRDSVSYLKEWIPAKVRSVFEVHEVSLEGNQGRKG